MLLATSLVLVLASGCGGEEEKDVRSAAGAFASAAETGNGTSYCNTLTPDTSKLLDTVARGLGEDMRCADLMKERLSKGLSGGLNQEALAAIEDAEIEIKGDRATIKDSKDTIPMRRVDGDWRVDLASWSKVGPSLHGSAACTQGRLDLIAAPLPPATRDGVAEDADANAARLRELREAVAQTTPSESQRKAVAAFDKILRDNITTWERTAKRLRGVGAPFETYNRGLTESNKRAERSAKDVEDLEIACAGDAQSFRDAAGYRRDADRAGAAAAKRFANMKRLEGPDAYREIVDDLTGKLRKIDPPKTFAKLHRSSVGALAKTAEVLPTSDRGRALERFELAVLRAAIGFNRMAIVNCAEL
ncbi:MAG: hypothetical protein AVDCRST_MAG85-2371 [uncultured Solirubrobacteraceae bacterium]|uniref:Uncharacterized protein n=1 Tax=uncultured Solirubrobacteraceae bacterium TaxID=1162706 RepID=A0A6J4T1P8_9ACTN|nr:MAG: hypothetical protein AVDCRST_MAG85-2371 [uncultured Solirubrobacteraceae bacterium]